MFQGHFDVVDCVFTHPQSLADDILSDASGTLLSWVSEAWGVVRDVLCVMCFVSCVVCCV